jgi:general secretion pathway protein J
MTRQKRIKRLKRGHGNSGFTLIELVVAIVLFTVLSLIVIGALRLGHRALNSGEKKAAITERLRSSLLIVDAQIGSQFSHMTGDGNDRKIYFAGNREYMQFATNYSLWGARRGYLTVTYEVVVDEQGYRALKVSEAKAGCAGVKTSLLFEGMTGIDFEYFEEPVSEEARWVDSWTDDNKHPEKVRIRLAGRGLNTAILVPMKATREKNVSR